MAAGSRDRQTLAGASLIAIFADAGGLILLIIGINTHFHNSGLSGMCSTGLGQVGQGLSPQAQAMCSHASAMSTLGIVLAIVGVVILVWGIKMSGGALIALSDERSVTPTRVTTSHARGAAASGTASGSAGWPALFGSVGVFEAAQFSVAERNQIGRPLQSVSASIDKGERIVRMASAVWSGQRGLLVLSDRRLFFIDTEGDGIEQEFQLIESQAEMGVGVLNIKDHHGSAEFSDLLPRAGTSAPHPVPPMATRATSEALMVRKCSHCDSKVMGSQEQVVCPNCGESLT